MNFVSLSFFDSNSGTKMQGHKNDLIAKLEGKSTAMADTLKKLDEQYVY